MDLMDRIFWGMVVFLGIHFLLLGFLETYIPFYLGSAFAFAYLIGFVGWGWKLVAGKDGESS